MNEENQKTRARKFYIVKDGTIVAETSHRKEALDLIHVYQSQETHFLLRATFSIIEGGPEEFIPYQTAKKTGRQAEGQRKKKGKPAEQQMCSPCADGEKSAGKSEEGTEEVATWYPVTVSSRKHGGGLRVNSGSIVKAAQRPDDRAKETAKMQYKTRYFSSWEEAQRVMNVIQSLDITTERVRMSATQGECKVFINGKFILSFGDNIVLPKQGSDPADYYGDDIGGWRSDQPDSGFVLGLIWHPLDSMYHYSDLICQKLGISTTEWIEERKS